MISALEFKQWLYNISEVTVNDEKNFLNILRSAFGLRGVQSDSELKQMPLRDVKTPPMSGPDGKETDMGVKKTIKNQQFYKLLKSDDPRKAALDDLDLVDGTIGDIVDIMVMR
jgi:hypothetical protein